MHRFGCRAIQHEDVTFSVNESLHPTATAGSCLLCPSFSFGRKGSAVVFGFRDPNAPSRFSFVTGALRFRFCYPVPCDVDISMLVGADRAATIQSKGMKHQIALWFERVPRVVQTGV